MKKYYFDPSPITWINRFVPKLVGISGLVVLLILLVLSAVNGLTRYYVDYKRHIIEGVHTDIPLGGKVFHCGTVVAIDFGRDKDGSFNFYDNTTGALIMGCGMWPGSTRACPPPEWTCGVV
jgi:hypothetical protein